MAKYDGTIDIPALYSESLLCINFTSLFSFSNFFLINLHSLISLPIIAIDLYPFSLYSLIFSAIAFIISSSGVYIGNIFGTKFKSKAQIFGGVILIVIGSKILIEHLISGT